jgi:hypothetical protein
MTVEQGIVALLVGLASVYLGRLGWKTARRFLRGSGCEQNCGCGSSVTAKRQGDQPVQLTLGGKSTAAGPPGRGDG